MPRTPDPLDLVRRRLGGSVRTLLAGDVAPDTPAFPVATADDPGWFGPGSATWQVHGDLSMIVGGLRALLLQTLHPLAMAGVADHSDYRDDPFGRLHRTGGFVAATTYGDSAAAARAVDMVRRVHVRVRGTAPDGRPYSASDPHLVTWVHVTEVDSFLAAHRRYGTRPISPADADRYVAEMAQVCEALGGDDPPRDVAALRAWIDGVRPELAVGRQARDAVRFLIAPPVPLVARGPYAVISAAAVGLLPAWARRKLWLPSAPLADPLVVRPAARALLAGLGWALGPPPHRTAAESASIEPAAAGAAG
ncbi:MAG TPA: oxygenase MpaB family protein [Acidimicrobiales bacterium]|nr:oxygenase MpaB family protein [Acidimicrobiales bacterium]